MPECNRERKPGPDPSPKPGPNPDPKPSPKPADKKVIPNLGDPSALSMIGLLVAGAAAMLVTAARARKKH